LPRGAPFAAPRPPAESPRTALPSHQCPMPQPPPFTLIRPSQKRANYLQAHGLNRHHSTTQAHSTKQLPQGVELLSKHVWLLEPPAIELHPLVWAAVCLAALTVMLLVSKQLRRCSDLSQATGEVDQVPALLLEALKDFVACQGPQSSVGDIGSGHPFLRARPGGVWSVFCSSALVSL